MPRMFARKASESAPDLGTDATAATRQPALAEPRDEAAEGVATAEQAASEALQAPAPVPPASFDDQKPPPGPEQGAPGRRRWVGPLQIGVVIALVAIAVAVSRTPSAPATPTVGGPGAGSASLVPLVNVVVPRSVSTAVEVEATGTIDARSLVALVPQVGGRIVSVSESLRAGGAFAADEVLLTIDPRDFQLGLEQARADVASAEADLRLRLAEGDAARANYAILHPGRRVPPLVARIPQIAQARARVDAARARLAIADLDFTRTRFALPFAGKVTETSAEVGQMLTRNQPFGQAFAFGALEAIAPVAQDELARLEPAVGRRATVRGAGLELEAIVERVSAELDARTRFARLYLGFAAPVDLAPGTFVDVTVHGPVLDDTFVLPDAAEQAGGFVWRVANGRLRRQDVTVLGRSPDGLVVRAFAPGEGVVVGAAPGGRDGASVRAVTANSARSIGGT